MSGRRSKHPHLNRSDWGKTRGCRMASASLSSIVPLSFLFIATGKSNVSHVLIESQLCKKNWILNWKQMESCNEKSSQEKKMPSWFGTFEDEKNYWWANHTPYMRRLEPASYWYVPGFGKKIRQSTIHWVVGMAQPLPLEEKKSKQIGTWSGHGWDRTARNPTRKKSLTRQISSREKTTSQKKLRYIGRPEPTNYLCFAIPWEKYDI